MKHMIELSAEMPKDLDELADLLVRPVGKKLGRVGKSPAAAAIIMAGGSGERFGVKGGKQLVQIAGRPILTWAIEAFDCVEDVGHIVIVAPKDRQVEYKRAAVEPFDFVTPITWAAAGAVRQESAFSGLEQVPDKYEFVVVHDGARPLISSETIMHVISTVRGNFDCDGAVVAHPAIDTLKVVEDGIIMGTPDRNVFWNAQTPQAFRTGIYRRAHAAALSDGFVGTDDSSLIERLGGTVRVVEGKRDNIKLTVPEDFLTLALALRALRAGSDGEAQGVDADAQAGGGDGDEGAQGTQDAQGAQGTQEDCADSSNEGGSHE